ncbi:MAG: hypothetical protein AAGF32_05500 [Pseudomonadota bacterium]
MSFHTLTAPLKALYRENDDARAFIDSLGSRKVGVRQTKVRVAADQCGLAHSQMLAVFRKLNALGIGKVKEGRNGHETRIKWRFHVVSIWEVATGQTMQLRELDDPNKDVFNAGTEHSYAVRPDFNCTITLPADITDVEAVRIAKWLKTIPLRARPGAPNRRPGEHTPGAGPVGRPDAQAGPPRPALPTALRRIARP